MEFVRYGGHSVLAGVALMLGGVLLALLPFLLPSGSMSSRAGHSVKLVILGVAAVYGGFSIAKSPSRIVLDRKRRTVRAVWDLIVAAPARVGPVQDGTPIRLSKHEVLVGHHMQTSHHVSVVGGFGEVVLATSVDLKTCREKAREAAAFFGAPLEDATGTEPVRIEAGEVGLSLRERARRHGDGPEIPDPPPGLRTTYDVKGDEVTFEISAPSLRGTHVAAVAAGLLVEGGLAVGLWYLVPGEMRPSGMSDAGWVYLGLFGLLMTIVAGVGLLALPGTLRIRETIVASPRGVSVDRRRLVRRRKFVMTSGQVEELVIDASSEGVLRSMLSPGLVVVARGRSSSLEFGTGLPREELDWLRGMVFSLLTAPLPTEGTAPKE